MAKAPAKTPTSVTVSFRVPPDVAKWIEARAAKVGKTRAEWLRDQFIRNARGVPRRTIRGTVRSNDVTPFPKASWKK